MSYLSKNLSVLAYANGFTLWHYRSADTADVIEGEGYFDAVPPSMMRVDDVIIVNANTEDDAVTKFISVVAIDSGVVSTGPVTGGALP